MMRRAGIHTIVLVAGMHLYWGGALLYSPHALGATPLAGLYEHIPSQKFLGMLLLAAGSGALIAAGIPSGFATLALLAPQQSALIMSLWASIGASVSGIYADGTAVAGGWVHVSVDQAPMIALVLCHAWAYVALHRGGAGE